MNEDWLQPTAAIPVSIEVTEALLKEVIRLRAALKQQEPEQEPVAWMTPSKEEVFEDEVLKANVQSRRMTTVRGIADKWPDVIPLYTHPPRREWVGLTDDERTDLWWQVDMKDMPEHGYGKAIEAKLKEKNGL